MSIKHSSENIPYHIKGNKSWHHGKVNTVIIYHKIYNAVTVGMAHGKQMHI